MTHVELVGLFSTFFVLLAVFGTLADRIHGEAAAKADRRHQAHRVK